MKNAIGCIFGVGGIMVASKDRNSPQQHKQDKTSIPREGNKRANVASSFPRMTHQENPPMKQRMPKPP